MTGHKVCLHLPTGTGYLQIHSGRVAGLRQLGNTGRRPISTRLLPGPTQGGEVHAGVARSRKAGHRSFLPNSSSLWYNQHYTRATGGQAYHLWV